MTGKVVNRKGETYGETAIDIQTERAAESEKRKGPNFQKKRTVGDVAEG